jgi:vanadium chloroperoxidase
LPPSFDNADYLAALRQGREKSIALELIATLPPGSSPPTPAETLVGIYWVYDGTIGLGTPPRLYNQIVREVAKAQGNDITANARLFALVNAAMGDAEILAWDQKYVHDFWRPVLGIREHDLSLGRTGTGSNAINRDSDPFWLPFGAPRTNDSNSDKNFTPPFPAYPSEHATFGAAAFHMTRLFYGWKGRCPDALQAEREQISFGGMAARPCRMARRIDRRDQRQRHHRLRHSALVQPCILASPTC